MARQGKTVMVALQDPFVCPSCGQALTPPDPATMRRSLILPLGGGGLLLLALLYGGIWLGHGRQKAPPPPATVAASTPAPTPASTASQDAITTLPAPTPATPPADATVIGSSGPGGPTSAGALMPPPKPPPPPPDNPPTTGSPEADAANGTAAAPAPAGAPSPEPGTAHPAPAQPAATPAGRHPHKVVAAGRSIHAPRAKPHDVMAEMLPLDGSRPDYPDEYENEGTRGAVTVTCLILADGRATDCRVGKAEGGARFGQSVVQWLSRSSTRFPPALKNGRPTTERFTWNIDFAP